MKFVITDAEQEAENKIGTEELKKCYNERERAKRVEEREARRGRNPDMEIARTEAEVEGEDTLIAEVLILR